MHVASLACPRGTGKTLLKALVHASSCTRKVPGVVVYCMALQLYCDAWSAYLRVDQNDNHERITQDDKT